MKRHTKLIYVAYTIIFLIIPLLVMEMLASVLYDNLTTQAGRYAAEVALSSSFLKYDEISDRPRFIPHPYMLYQLTPNYSGHFKTNSLGYRNEEFTLLKTDKRVRMLVLGGSTTYGAGVDDLKKTWPAKLGESLKNNCMQEYEVINGGVDSASSAEILNGWIYKYRNIKPDIVVLNLGINDIWPILLTKDYSTDYSYFRKSQSYVDATQFSLMLMKLSNVYKVIWSHIFGSTIDSGYPFIQALDSDLIKSERLDGKVTKRAIENENEGFKNNFEYLVRILQLDGVKVFVINEPSMGLEDFKIKVGGGQSWYSFIAGLENPWLIIKRKNEEIMKSISKKYSAEYFLMDDKAIDKEMYTDWYHLNEQGEERKAKLIGGVMRERKFVCVR